MITRVLTLVAYTALPIVGVLWLGWDWREIVLLYWLENVSLGVAMFVTLLRTARATPVAAPAPETPSAESTSTATTDPTTLHPAAGLMLAFFFATHYGMFTLVHGVFVYVLVTGGIGPIAVDPRPLNLGGVLLVWGDRRRRSGRRGTHRPAAERAGHVAHDECVSAHHRAALDDHSRSLRHHHPAVGRRGRDRAHRHSRADYRDDVDALRPPREIPPRPATVGLPHGAR